MNLMGLGKDKSEVQIACNVLFLIKYNKNEENMKNDLILKIEWWTHRCLFIQSFGRLDIFHN